MSAPVFDIQNGILLGCIHEPEDKRILIPDGVREIGKSAFFSDCTVEEIIIPEGVEVIGDSAFTVCSNLREVRMPSTVRSVGWGAFSFCKSLQVVVLPEGLEDIDESAFDSTTDLLTILLAPDTALAPALFSILRGKGTLRASAESTNLRQEGPLILSRDNKVLYYCQTDAEGTIQVPEGVEQVADSAFEDCKKIRYIRFPESLRLVGDRAFVNCPALEAIRFPEHLDHLGMNAFLHCSGLRSLRIPEGITRLTRNLFGGCSSLEELRLPHTLKAVLDAFSGCHSLAELVVPDSVQVFRSRLEDCSIDRVVFQGPVYSMEPNELVLHNPHILVADWFPFGELSYLAQWQVACGVLDRLERGEPVGEETLRDCSAWIRENIMSLWEEPNLRRSILLSGMLTPETYQAVADAYFSDNQSPELTALLLDYPNRFFTPEERNALNQKRFALDSLDENGLPKEETGAF